MPLRALARVNLAAITRNCRVLDAAAGDAALCAVVKGDGYGHGAVASAQAALEGGATWIAVATAGEAADLRVAGIEARLIVLGAVSPEELELALFADADLVAWSAGFVAAVAAHGGGRLHVKLDTGMGRLGTRSPEEATDLVHAIEVTDGTELIGLTTHFATADERGDAFLAEQLERFEAWAGPLKAERQEVIVHAANSAATLREPRSHFDLVRCGIAIYGMDPFHEDPAEHGLEPALTLESYVAAVKPIAPGESAGYGRRFVAETPSVLATVPIGYGDGVRRGSSGNADVLVGGRRRPLAGTVSMDNITVDLGEGATEQVGAPVVLVGEQDGERILAEEIARRLGTITYEVTTCIMPRVPRSHHRDGREA